MPFLSKAQQRFMFENHPEIAKRWAGETKNFDKLPEHISKLSKKQKKEVLKKSIKKHIKNNKK